MDRPGRVRCRNENNRLGGEKASLVSKASYQRGSSVARLPRHLVSLRGTSSDCWSVSAAKSPVPCHCGPKGRSHQSQGAAPPIFSTMKTCCDCCAGCLPDRCPGGSVICAPPSSAERRVGKEGSRRGNSSGPPAPSK